MARPVDRAPMAGEAPDGGRRRRDRHRRGDRSDRPERSAAPADLPAGEEPGALVADTSRPTDVRAPREQFAAEIAPQITAPSAGEPSVAPEGTEAPREPVQPVEPVRTQQRAEAPAAPARVIPPAEPVRTQPPTIVESAVASIADSAPPPPARASAPIAPAVTPVSMKLPSDSGLEMVETRFKPAPAAAPETEAPPAGARRVRPPRVVVADEPLQIVETRKGEQPPAG